MTGWCLIDRLEAALGAALLAAHTVGLVSDGEMDTGGRGQNNVQDTY